MPDLRARRQAAVPVSGFYPGALALGSEPKMVQAAKRALRRRRHPVRPVHAASLTWSGMNGSVEYAVAGRLREDPLFYDLTIPVILVELDGKTYLLDGYHRATAARLQRHEQVPAVIVSDPAEIRLLAEAHYRDAAPESDEPDDRKPTPMAELAVWAEWEGERFVS